MERKLVGYVSVDSGQVVLVDPCYLGDWKDGEYNDKESHYGKACDLTLSEEQAGQMVVSGVAGIAVASSSGYGDGVYPVYATYNDEKRIEKLEIKFIEEHD